MNGCEFVFGFQPLEITGDPLLGHEQGQRLEVFQLGDLRFRVGQEDLRILLEHRGDLDHRHFIGHRVEGLQRVGAKEEVELAGDQQHAVVVVGAARHDGDVEPVLLVGAVGEGLEKSALLALRQPIGSERDLVQRLCAGGGGGQHCGEQGRR
jgi:hypothetical protein